MGNSFGQLFRITTWGESHGGGVGVVIDGCPPRLELCEDDIQRELDRRRPGQSNIVTERDEPDRCQIFSGVFEGRTLGTPISHPGHEQGCAAGSLRGDGADLPPFPRRFHLRSEIRNSKLAGRGPSLRARNDRARRGRRGRGEGLERTSSRLQSDRLRTQIHDITATIEARGREREEVEANPMRCPDARAAAGDDSS